MIPLSGKGKPFPCPYRSPISLFNFPIPISFDIALYACRICVFRCGYFFAIKRRTSDKKSGVRMFFEAISGWLILQDMRGFLQHPQDSPHRLV